MGLEARGGRGARRKTDQIVEAVDATPGLRRVEDKRAVGAEGRGAGALRARDQGGISAVYRARRRQRETMEARAILVVGAIVEQLGVAGAGARGRGNEARAGDPLSVPGQAGALTQAALGDLRELLAIVPAHPGDPAFVQLLVGAACAATDVAIDGVGEELIAGLGLDRGQDVEAVGFGEPPEEARAVQVPDVPLRPAAREVGHLIEAHDPVLEDVGAHVHLEHARADAAGAGATRLVEDGHAFEEPAGLGLVGDEGLADDPVDERGGAGHMVGVQNVRVLVADETEVPVVVIAQRGHVVRRGHEQPHRVVRHRGGRAVGFVGPVGDHHLGDLARLPAQLLRHASVQALEHVGDALGDGLAALVEVHAEVRRVDGEPRAIRIVCGACGGNAAHDCQQQPQGAQDSQGASLHRSSWNIGSRLRT